MRLFSSSLLLIVFAVSLVPAQDWSWPEKAENLQVLPEDFPGSRLSAVMRGFTRTLGVRCSHCHVGEEGQPLSTYDFVSDENPNKQTARVMLEMLGDINESLKAIEPTGSFRVNMWCGTCHRGRPRPMTLGEELREAYGDGDVDAAIAHYRDLRERFYGRGAYDFGESALNAVGYAALERDVAGALAIFELNAEMNPESFNVWDSLAEAHMAAGNRDEAIRYYEKSLELEPRNQNAVEKLKELRG